MPLTVSKLFKRFGLKASGPIPWGQNIECNEPGVYVVSLSNNPNKNDGLLEQVKINEQVFIDWKRKSPKLNIYGSSELVHLQQEINFHWKPNENVIYIGESSSTSNGLAKRLKQFYSHKVGNKGPHTGGYWVKLLNQSCRLFIYHAECNNPREVEFQMLIHFIEETTCRSISELDELGKKLPFGNLKADFPKIHNIKKAVSKE